jgi:hypothetical protein
MNWYQKINEIAQNLAQTLADNPEIESEIQEQISMLSRDLQKVVWNRINFYIHQYLEQGGGSMKVFMSKEE